MVKPHQAMLPGTAIPPGEWLSWHLPWAEEDAQLINRVKLSRVRMGPQQGEDRALGWPDPAWAACSSKRSFCRAPADKKRLHSCFQRPERIAEWGGSEIQTPDNGKAGNIKERKFFCCIAFPMAIR